MPKLNILKIEVLFFIKVSFEFKKNYITIIKIMYQIKLVCCILKKFINKKNYLLGESINLNKLKIK